MNKEMGPEGDKARRKPRADSLRNREKLLSAAAEVFREGGPEASLEAVARRAGVGIGTLYRHFPTRDALFEGVYRRDVDALAEMAERLAAELPPGEALRRWLHCAIDVIAVKKGMLEALALATEGKQELFSYSKCRMNAGAEALIGRAVAAGEIRADVVPDDLWHAVIGFCAMRGQPGWRERAGRLVDIFADGLSAAL
ncbi:TetR/AcrR family transcriptional regulator [Acidimangrovimonas sediminis]|uniref:TetR/AcrR family transcriptional regulator n=1 Tax=Acidimangrovimonas sediminis TaxID=2056283 RepID=UPI001E52489D|nr:TetR/AcrR family transcriptional regulator [Acidimangrovimonas sediminis]